SQSVSIVVNVRSMFTLWKMLKAVTDFASCYGDCRLLRRMQQRLSAVAEAVAVKVATEVTGCWEGYHKGCRLLRRLPHRVQADVKADAIELVGCCGGCEGCHRGSSLVEGPSSEPKGHSLSTNKCRYDRASQTELVKQDMANEELVNSHDLLRPFILPINREAITKFPGLPPRIRLTSIIPMFVGREVVTFRLQGGDFYKAFNRAFDGAFDKAFDGAFYGSLTGPSTGLRQGLLWRLQTWEKGP
ncbi:hypothetical protein Tco_1196052, partial [Tanacetum coccineum]